MSLKKWFLYLFLCFLANQLHAQNTINGPKIICLGNLASYTYTPPTGSTVASINWDFGDGGSSSNTAPSHQYTSTGNYTITATATLSNSSVSKATLIIDVVPIPKPFFYFNPFNDSCLNRNKICVYDTSSPGVTGQKIISRLIVWGDGGFETNTLPKKGDSTCHVYGIADKYTIRMELTDNKGCKNSVAHDINIIQTVTDSFTFTQKFTNCYQVEICVKNNSFAFPNNKGRFRWLFDTSQVDTMPHYTNAKCVRYGKSRMVKIQLVGFVNPVCYDTFTKVIPVLIDSLPTSIELLDTLRCYSDNSLNEASIKNVARDDIKWYDDLFDPFTKSNLNYFTTQKAPGVYQVKVEIYRGSCVTTLTAPFRVQGPVAQIKIYNKDQCFRNKDVFMVSTSKFINPAHCTYKWEISDPYGQNCIQQRIKDINKYKNCNISKDWFDKHKFSSSSGKVKVFFSITDTITGCMDSTRDWVNMQNCPPILNPDTIFRCQNTFMHDTIKQPVPKKFTLNHGQTWLTYPQVLDTSYNGDYEIGFAFETPNYGWAEHYGDDSLRLHSDTITEYDTIYRQQTLRVYPLKTDTFTLKVYGHCKPYRVSIQLTNGHFKKGEKIYVNWADKNNVDLLFNKDTIIDSVFHVYPYGAVQAPIQILLTSANGCETRYRMDVNLGKLLTLPFLKPINCIYNKVCFNPQVRDMVTGMYWTKNTNKNYVTWILSDTSAPITRFNPCYYFKSGGLRDYKMVVTDSFGCKDTIQDSVFVQDLNANIKRNGFTLYCAELKQFFDSSSYCKYPAWRKFKPNFYIDSIKSYAWQFGSGSFSSIKRNPVQSINTSLDSIPASLAIQSYSGCVDTFKFFINSLGPKPYFYIKDTIGCQSLYAEFINKSRFSKHYIWSFGDSAKSSQFVSNLNPVYFNYNHPGRYSIQLVGIDTIYNPFTKQKQACYTTFPDPIFQKDTHRTVLVLPFKRTGLLAPDTVCVGERFTAKSLSDTAYNKDLWTWGDNNTKDTSDGLSLNHRYTQSGLYLIQLKPSYNKGLYNFCRDSAKKSVTVLGVKADFNIDPSSKPPVFKFNNLSSPVTPTTWLWQFGQLGNNDSSTLFEPSKDYGNDTGHFQVCLIAQLPFGCKDTFCQVVFNDRLPDFGIFNVFTPGQLNQLNDVYDIIIENETYYNLQIFDRWGKQVYYSEQDYGLNDPRNWNGKVNNTGAECSSGTYYYIFQYRLQDQPELTKLIEGSIQLIR